MKLSAKQKKWIKTLLILFCIRLVVGGILYYIIVYRFKDIVQIVVNKETKGAYTFDASKVDFSLFKKNIVINDAVLRCNDTLRNSPHYDLKIPQLYFSLSSWNELIFHRRLSVDSLSIALPQLKTHDHETQKAKHLSFQASQVLSALQKTVTHLQIRSLTLTDGSFTYSKTHSLIPFISNRINLIVKNFSKKSKQSGKLLSADDIDLSLTNQRWSLPDGIHTISFRSLHFSGKNQFFELDSCTFHTEPAENKAAVSLSADKLYFNSKQLSATYEKEELLIDTLICVRPVLNLQTASTKNQVNDSAAISQSVRQLFKGMRFNYIDIDDGQLLLDDKNKLKPSYISQKTDLKIYNLRINPDSSIHIKTDSIELSLKNIQFVTTDSLYQLNIAEFELKNNDVIFRNALFSPTIKNHNGNDLVFRTPYLRLKNIRMEELLKKRLKADEAELYHPAITVFNRKKPRRGDTAVHTGKIGNFYRALHDLHELIAVKDFNIVNGNLHYQSSGSDEMEIGMKDISSSLLLDRFLTSDSLIDIKRSMPRLTIGVMTAQSKKLKLHIDNYVFTGFNRHNHIDGLELSLANGTSVKGKQLYWEILDWDLLAQKRLIQFQEMRIKELLVNIDKQEQAGRQQPPRDLPVLRMGRLDIDRLQYNMQTADKGNMSFTAQSLCVDELRSQKRFLLWNTMLGQLNDVSVDNKDTKISIQKIDIDNEHETILSNLLLDINKDSGSTVLRAPTIRLSASLQSTDFSRPDIRSLIIENPEISIVTHGQRKNKTKPFSMPVAVNAAEFMIKNGTLNYTSRSEKDTVAVSAGINIAARSLRTYKDEEKLFSYDKADINLADLRLNKHTLDLSIPRSSLALAGGKAVKTNQNGIAIHSGTLFKWSDLKFKIQQPGKSELALEHVSGNFENPSFSLGDGNPPALQSLLFKTSISEGAIHFRNKAVTAAARSVQWDPYRNKLSLRSFSFFPNLSMEEAFRQAAWQADYLTVQGESLDIDGIQFNPHEKDSSLGIHKIVLQKIALTTARDKLKPFKHGEEKLMPTRLISSVKYPFHVDSLIVNQGSVTVMENSIITHQHGTIPLERLNAVITNIKNRDNANDSLVIVANAKLFNNYIRHFHYQEAYGDSLSYFTVNFNASPMVLPEYSQVTAPLAAVSVNDGRSDTLFARWVGNKYAAFGRMDFYYDNLKVRLLDKRDPSKKGFLLSLENMLANAIIINKKNSKHSQVYFERDREKFVFNYWVKTSLRGLLSSIGIKSSRKYYKQYMKAKDLYSLPLYID